MRINNRRLDADEFSAFEEALRDAFNPKEFQTMLRKRMGWKILGRSVDDHFFTEMIDRAENNEETQELLTAALTTKSGSSLLGTFAQRVGVISLASSHKTSDLSKQSPASFSAPPSLANPSTHLSKEASVGPLERQVNELHSSLEPVFWRSLMEERERQVCRIVIQGWEKGFGTGFLLGTDVVMTNYHVLKDVIDGPIPPSRVSLYFDYKLKEDGKTLDTGSEHQLADIWLLDHSEHSSLDLQSTEQCVDVDERHLDYALIRLKRKAGEERLGRVKRGWIDFPEIEYDFKSGTALLILHHPHGNTLKFDLDTRSILGINTNKTRVCYTTNTEYGSSGAPCFNANWELVAIHQSGDPDFKRSAQYNQGIPIATILLRLKRHGNNKYLGSKQEKKTVKKRLSAVPHTDSVPAQFAAPESMMSKEAQQQLIRLLDKQSWIAFSPSSSASIRVTSDMLTHIDSKHLPHHLYFLLRSYIQATSSLIERARAPFYGPADLQRKHFRYASEKLDLVEDCLRKMCILSKHATSFWDLDLITQITLEADSVIEKKSKLCQFLAEQEEQYKGEHDDSIKREIKNKFADFIKDLNEFRERLPKI